MSASYKTFLSPGGPTVNGVSYILDSGLVMPDGSTGGFRPLATTDISPNSGAGDNVNVTNSVLAVSGVFLSAGGGNFVSGVVGITGGTVNAAITGNPVITITGIQTAVNVGGYLGVTGNVQTVPGVPTSANAQTIVTINSAFTRPNNNTAYVAGQLITNSTTATTFNALSGAAFASGRGGVIQNLVLAKTGTSITNAQFGVHFFNFSGATIPGQDGVGMTGLYSNAAYYLGPLYFPAMTTGTGPGSVGRAWLQQQAFMYNSLDPNGNLYWLLEAEAAYTPAATEGFTLTATLLRD